jgi:hypothetical protein
MGPQWNLRLPSYRVSPIMIITSEFKVNTILQLSLAQVQSTSVVDGPGDVSLYMNLGPTRARVAIDSRVSGNSTLRGSASAAHRDWQSTKCTMLCVHLVLNCLGVKRIRTSPTS